MTGRFRNILLAMSPGVLEPSVLREAVELADTHGARLTILDVVQPLPRLRWAKARRRTTDVDAGLAADRLAMLRRMAADLEGLDRAHVEVAVGQPHVEVVARVLEHDHDLVIVGCGGAATSDVHMLPNGVTQLLRKCPVPVWAMRAPCPGGPRVLALIDPDPDDPVRDGLNARVLELAASLARNGDGELHVGHAIEGAGGPNPQLSTGVTPQASPAVGRAEPAETHRDRVLGDLLRRRSIGESEAAVHLVAGHTGEALPTLADDLSADLVVMGTVARTGISGLIIGNSAETMLTSVACSVLAVKPDDLVETVAPAADKVA